MVYLDNAATTRVDPVVAKTIYDSMQNDFANPSALYDLGAEAEHEMNIARRTVAGAIGAKPSEVIFTSNASEGNSIAIYGLSFARQNWGKKLVTTSYEHAAVRKSYEFLSQFGYEIIEINPHDDGMIYEDDIISAVDENTALVSLIHVNNETGAVIDIDSVAKRVKSKNRRTAVHIDATQSFLKYDLDVRKLSIDTMSFSAHKVYCPKGIGALYVKSGTNIKPVFVGGGQEGGLRAGTENIHYIKGFAKAVEIYKPLMHADMAHYALLKEYLLSSLKRFDNVVINSPDNAAPYTVNFSFIGYRSETLLHFLDSMGICVSSGSACSKGAQSVTLSQMNLKKDVVDSALRISFAHDTQHSDIDALIDGLKQVKEKLQRVKK